MEGLGLAVGGVNEVRMGRAEIASKFVEGFGADEYGWWAYSTQSSV